MSDPERSVRAARAVRLDPSRQASALRRVEAARLAAEHHERQAAAERAKIDVLIRTWDLCPRPTDAPIARLPCCQNPSNCAFQPASSSEA